MKVNLAQLLDKVGDVALRRRAAWLIQSLDLKNGNKVLDVGCGDGFYLSLLANLGLDLKLTGIDTNIRALKSAEENLKGNKVTLIEGDVLKLPFVSTTFDRVVASEVLEHVPDDESAVKEIKRVLKPGGVFALSVPHKNYPFFWDPINWTLEHLLDIHIKSGFWAGIWNQHLRLYTEANLQTLLKKGGFKKATVAKLTHYCLPFNHYIINVVAILLASKKMPNMFRKLFSKYEVKKQEESKGGLTKGSSFSVLSPIFFLDQLNDNWDKKGSAVSLVAVCEK